MLGFLNPVSIFLPKILKRIKKVPLWFWLIIIIGVGYWHYNGKLDEARAEVAHALLDGDSTVTLLEGQWSARLAQKELELESAKELADELQSELIASATIEITPEKIKRDTITLVTELLSDSTRIATLSDTTVYAVLEGKVVVPPCCADIRIRYTLTPRPIKFDVALVRTTDNEAVFAVSYFGGSTQIFAPYARLPEPIDRFKPFVGMVYDFSDIGWSVQGGVELDLFFGVELEAFLQQDLVQQVDTNSLKLLVQGRKYF